MRKSVTIDKFFTKKRTTQLDLLISTAPSVLSDDNLPHEILSQQFRKVDIVGIDLNSFERDPGLHQQIWENSRNEQEEIRRAYLNMKAYQPLLSEYPLNKNNIHPRRFQSSWYELFPWLEYDPTKDKAFYFPCCIYNKSSGCPKKTTFTVDGFDNWKKARSVKTCSFQCHIGKDNISSSHCMAEKACEDLMNQPRHIPRLFKKVSAEVVARNRLWLTVGIYIVRLLALQGVPFRGHDESSNSFNRGNFLEFLDVVALYSDELSCAIKNAPKNVKYTCHDIQKQILHIFSVRVKNVIYEEISANKYRIVVDEARDESKREQMSIVLRFVDINGCVQERFFGLVHVPDTTALTLKNVIYSSLTHYNLDVQNMPRLRWCWKYEGRVQWIASFDLERL